MIFFVYIIYAEKFDKYYIGQTNDFEVRLKRHNSGFENYTSPFKPWTKVLVLEKNSRAAAIELERKLKNLSKKRICDFIRKYR